MTIDSTASLLSSLGLLESTMKSLANILSRAFLHPLFENPVGWQFVYTKHDATAPSITMRSTNYTTEDLIPHGCIPPRTLICFNLYPSYLSSISFLNGIPSRSFTQIPFLFLLSASSAATPSFRIFYSHFRSYLRLPRMYLRFPLHQPPHPLPNPPKTPPPPPNNHPPLQRDSQ
jgi:hypothetical protein